MQVDHPEAIGNMDEDGDNDKEDDSAERSIIRAFQ